MHSLPNFIPKRQIAFKRQQGFTLIELVLVIVLLGIVGVGISGFVRGAAESYLDMTSREALLRDGSFFAERFTRELNNAVPNSARISGNASVHCLQFVPMNWNTHYLNIPLVSETNTSVDLIELHNDLTGQSYVPDSDDLAIVYPITSDHVYGVVNSSEPDDIRARSIVSCSDDGDGNCATNDDADAVVQLEVSDGFYTDSPARRIYIADSSVNFCVRNNQVYRHESSISAVQPLFTSGGVLMAQNINNVLSANPQASAGSQDPFRLIESALRRNAYIQARFLFSDGDEQISVLKEVHVPNVP